MVKFSFWPHTGLGKFSLGAFLIFALAILLRILQMEFSLLQTRMDDILGIYYFFIEYIAGALSWLSGVINYGISIHCIAFNCYTFYNGK